MAVAKYISLISGRLKEVIATVTSAGAGDEGKLVALDASGRLDSTMMPVGLGADTKSIMASENLAGSDLVNVWFTAGIAKVRKADASTAGKEANGFVLSSVTAGAMATVYFEGNVTGLTTLTPGDKVYLSSSIPGSLTVTAPSGSGHVVQYVGTCISATEITFEPDAGVILA